MGMDLIAIIGHKLTSSKILDIPKRIDDSKGILEVFRSDKPTGKIRISKWEGPFPMTAKNIDLIWEGLRTNQDLQGDGFNYYSDLDTYFGDLAIYEKTITVSPNPEHKYGNLEIPDACEYIIKLNREIAKLFNANQIVYCADSYVSTGVLDEKGREGWSINEIINFGINKFGEPPKEMNQAVHNYFFIDSFDLNPKDLDPNRKVWSRYHDEYEKSKKKK